MNIAMFTNTYLPHVGGVARSVQTFVEELQRAGHRCLIVAPEYDDAETSDDLVLRVPAIHDFNKSGFSVAIPAPNAISDRLDHFKPDVIHSHHPFLLGDAALRAARQRCLPLFFTHHTLYEQYVHYLSIENDPTVERVAIGLSTEYANQCDQVIAPSESIAKLLRERGVTKPVEVIPTGVDLDFYANGDRTAARTEYSLPQDAFVIGHLGRLAPEKNLAYLAASVTEALQSIPKAWFLLVGHGAARADMERIFRDARVGDRVASAGALTGTAIADAYAAMDVFTFSSFSETQGMVMVEAMASGAPVVALDAPGAREVVATGKNGILLPASTPTSDFARHLATLARDNHRLAQLRRGALESAAAYSKDRAAAHLASLYAPVCEKFSLRRQSEHFDEWDGVAARFRAELDLIGNKGAAIVAAIQSDFEDLEDVIDPKSEPTP